jgi:hypothetical protein
MTLQLKRILITVILLVGMASAFAVGYFNHSWQEGRQNKAATVAAAKFVSLLADGKANEAFDLTTKKNKDQTADQFATQMKAAVMPNATHANAQLYHTGKTTFYSESLNKPGAAATDPDTNFYLTMVKQKGTWKVDAAIVL